MKATQIVTVKSFSLMFKEGEEANNIQICNVEEHGFNVVVQKGLYNIGEKILFIQPDFCLSNISLFNPYIMPDGNRNKSKLGDNNRIRAVNFGFTDSNGNKVSSNGILLPLTEVHKYLEENGYSFIDSPEIDYDIELSISKFEKEEKGKTGDSKGVLPSGMHKTDETNFHNNSGSLELPCELIGTLKIDGSSITIFWKNEESFGICSRSLEKKLTKVDYPGYGLYYDRESNKRVWTPLEDKTLFIEDIDLYFKENGLEKTEVQSDDDWVKLGSPILEKLKELKRPLAIRGEVYGKTLKGSGNKHNPHAKMEKSIAIYGIDDYSSGTCIALPMEEVLKISVELHLPLVPVVFTKVFETLDELKQECENYFKENLVEGIVIRTFKTNSYSGKYMSNDYDSKK